MDDVMERIQMQDMYCREILEIKERPRHDNLKNQKIQTKKSKRQKWWKDTEHNHGLNNEARLYRIYTQRRLTGKQDNYEGRTQEEQEKEGKKKAEEEQIIKERKDRK